MTYSNQTSALEMLKSLSETNIHSILIHGPEGTGKTYLAKEFSKIKGIPDFVILDPNVNDLRDAMDSCIDIRNELVLCIENLDRGNLSASYALLKFLEEPPNNIYIIVTCRNIEALPDTIMSRTSIVPVCRMSLDDLILYSKNVNAEKYNVLVNNNRPIWNCVRSTNDIDALMNLGQPEYDQIMQTQSLLFSNSPISYILWKLQKFQNGLPVPIEFSLWYVMNTSIDKRLFRACHECIKDIQCGRVAVHAALANLCFMCKYMIGGG